MKLALIGLPMSGKTIIFEALTGVIDQHGSYSGGKVPIAAVKVPDERMEFLRELCKPKKFTLATVEYHDVGGIFSPDPSIKPSPQALQSMREADGLIKIVRAFKNDSVPHPRESVDALRDIREIEDDLLLLDLDQVERRIEKLEKVLKKPLKDQEQEKKELAALEHCRKTLDNGGTVADVKFTEEESLLLKGFRFLTEKPSMTVLNVGEDDIKGTEVLDAVKEEAPKALAICGKVENEIQQLDAEDRAEFLTEMGIAESAGPRLIRASYDIVEAISFFTHGSDEVRAWTVRRGDNAVTAAGKIHTDLARGFIRAEIMAFDDLKAFGDFKQAKAKGKARLEGKDYIMQDGDIVDIRFAT